MYLQCGESLTYGIDKSLTYDTGETLISFSLQSKFLEQTFRMAVIIHDGKHPSNVHSYATLKGIVKFEVTRHCFPVAIESKTYEAPLSVEHT